MKNMLAELLGWSREGEQVALATLVRVHGSAPRRPGARLGVTRGGRLLGSVSGGCVENDVVETAWRVLDAGRPELVVCGAGDAEGWEAGLACGGRIEVLVDRFCEDEAWRALGAALEARRPVALCVGLAPAALRGRRLVVDGDATTGSIDADLDAAIVARARGCAGEAGAGVVALPGRDGGAEVFLDLLLPAPRLFLVGATHAAIPLCRMARVLGFRVTVIDPRSAWANAERIPEVDELVLDWPTPALEAAGLDGQSCVVTLSHDPKLDLPALEQALASPARYIGALGSRRTHEARKAQLRERGFDDRALARVRSPVGLDLGGRSPEEIALAILAELVAVRNGRAARPLCEGRGPIHAGR